MCRDIESSTWSTEGVTTVSVMEDSEGKEFTVFCESNHLTAFAVLMDVTGAINVTLSVQSIKGGHTLHPRIVFYCCCNILATAK